MPKDKEQPTILGAYEHIQSPTKAMRNIETREGLDTVRKALLKRGAIDGTHRVLFLVDVALDKLGRVEHISMSCGGIEANAVKCKDRAFEIEDELFVLMAQTCKAITKREEARNAED